MSDYMFMLENHLTADQSRVLAEVQAAAAHAGVSLFLTGGAIRDMLGGFPIRDLDFTVEGNPLKLAKTIERCGGLARSRRASSTTAAVPDALSSAPFRMASFASGSWAKVAERPR